MPIAALLPVFSTLLGGLAALRLRHRLHPIMALAAGVLIATALLELLPEASALVGSLGDVVPFTLVGFLVYTALEGALERSAYEHQHKSAHPHVGGHAFGASHEDSSRQSLLGIIGPLGLIFHSTMDGVAIGLGFSAGTQVGIIVTLAVVGHDFADGLNVVTLALASGVNRFRSRVLLVTDALVVPAGAFIGANVAINNQVLGSLLGIFAGVFIAIGAGHLLPEARNSAPQAGVWMALCAGAGVLIVVGIRAVASNV